MLLLDPADVVMCWIAVRDLLGSARPDGRFGAAITERCTGVGVQCSTGRPTRDSVRRSVRVVDFGAIEEVRVAAQPVTH